MITKHPPGLVSSSVVSSIPGPPVLEAAARPTVDVLGTWLVEAATSAISSRLLSLVAIDV